ncbi:unnamed protein product [Prorocentrum cordatum]|uniref:Uncharacterized protein n=1 Tax=Prorocentrum cordatum TaxID=2364126 RepID=A0ABN9Y9F5_9DINO|nr:unnamed protein product [Polarella glacialis]
MFVNKLLHVLPAWERGIVLALGSGLFLPFGGVVALVWRPGRVDRQLSRIVAFSSGALITATLLEIFPTAFSTTVDEGYDKQWSYALCTSVMFAFVVATILGKIVSEQPAILISKMLEAVRRTKDADIHLERDSQGARVANKFISDWRGFDDERWPPRRSSRLSSSSKAGGRVRTSRGSATEGMLAAQRIVDSLLKVARDQGDLRRTLDDHAGQDVVERGSFTPQEFCRFVLDVTKADDSAFAEPLWEELSQGGPTLELLARMLQPFWELARQRHSVRTSSTGGLIRSLHFAQFAKGQKHSEDDDDGASVSGVSLAESVILYARLDQMEEFIVEQLEPAIRPFSDHLAAFLTHVLTGTVIYHIWQVDQKTATVFAVMNVLRNVPEGLLLTSNAISSLSGSHWAMNMKMTFRAFTGSLIIGLSEGLGAGLASLMAFESVQWPREVFIVMLLALGATFIYAGVCCYMNKAKEINPDKEFPSYSFMVGTTVMSFAMVVVDAGPLRTGETLGRAGTLSSQ